MDAASKSYEIQAQIKNNSEEFKNAINDLYNWQNDIKNQEKLLNQSKFDDESKNRFSKDFSIPIRSHHIQREGIKKSSKTSLSDHNLYKNSRKVSGDKKADHSVKHNTGAIPKESIGMKREMANKIKEKGNTHAKLGEYTLAIKEYTKAIVLYNKESTFYANRAFCYLKLEQYLKCINDCDCAIQLDKRAVKAYYRRMLANEVLVNNTEALKDCSKILEIDPKNVDAQRAFDRIYARLNKNKRITPTFSPLESDMIDIFPVELPPHKRSTVPLKRVPITDIFTMPNVEDEEEENNGPLKISDEDIDKLFNSCCGEFVEVKPDNNKNYPNLELKNELTSKNTKPTKIGKVKKAPVNDGNKKTIAKQIEPMMPLVIETLQPLSASSPSPLETTTEECKTPDTLKKSKAPVKNDTSSQLAETNSSSSVPTVSQFYISWRNLPEAEKYDFLKVIEERNRIPLSKLNKVLGGGFDSDTFIELVEIISRYETNTVTIMEYLSEICKHKQTAILSLLMSNEERQVLWEVICRLKNDPMNIKNNDIIEDIINRFNLK